MLFLVTLIKQQSSEDEAPVSLCITESLKIHGQDCCHDPSDRDNSPVNNFLWSSPQLHFCIPEHGLPFLASASDRSNSLPSPFQTLRPVSAAQSVILCLVGSRDPSLQLSQCSAWHSSLQSLILVILDPVEPNPHGSPLLLKCLHFLSTPPSHRAYGSFLSHHPICELRVKRCFYFSETGGTKKNTFK